jgi:hypothetical protein
VSKRSNNLPPALKHGAYSCTTVLPGEDEAAFKKLHDGLVAEFAPAGPLEEDIVDTLAFLQWRKANLRTFRLAMLARDRYSAIWAKTRPPPRDDLSQILYPSAPEKRSPEEIRAATEAAKRETREELGEAMQLVEMGSEVTIERLFEELSVVERLDGMIDRAIKRLLLVRGVKSMSLSSSIAPAPSRKRRVA